MTAPSRRLSPSCSKTAARNSAGDLRNFLYENNGDGSFARIATGVIATDAFLSRRGVWGDFDNDGDPDLFVANEGFTRNSLYENLGGGSFVSISAGSITGDFASSWSGSWGDYDNNGDLDLFVANSDGQKNNLYRNDGGGTFTKMTASAVADDVSYSTSSN